MSKILRNNLKQFFKKRAKELVEEVPTTLTDTSIMTLALSFETTAIMKQTTF